MPPGDSKKLRIDVAAECIWRNGEKIGVPPKAFLVLRRLMEQPGELVTKNELLDAVWPNTHVTERVLNNAVGCLREALGDDRHRPRFIETVHRRGFRWIGPASPSSADVAPTGDSPEPVALEPQDGSTFVGRVGDLAELSRCLARSHAGQRQVVLISGEPGIGKTALVDEFLKRLAVTRLAVKGSPPPPNSVTANPLTACLLATGQCIESYGAVDLYRPFREAVERLVRAGGDETDAIFRRFAPSWLLSAPELSSPAELETLRRSALTATAESVQRELERAIEAVSAERTLVLVLEDLHWSEPPTVALMWALAARREPARLMIIGTYRSEEAIARQHPIMRLKRELTAKRQCIDLALAGLADDAVAAFLDQHFPQHQLSGAFASRLCDQTTGNPLFLLNALADFERRGYLREQEGVWRCARDLDAIFATVPESTRDLIATRLEQLPATTRELLEVASVAGDTFATQAVAAAAERECADVEAELEPLARAAFFLRRGDEIEWPDGTRGCQHQFRHALYRQVLLRGITPSRRQQLHRKIALALQQGYGDRVGEIAAALSVHHEQAGDALAAVDYIEMLVQQAYERSAAYEAEAMLGHAVHLLRRIQPSAARNERLLKVTIAHGLALATTRGVSSVESLHALEDARTLGQALPTSAEHVASTGAMVGGLIMRGQLREARSLAQETLAMLSADESPPALVLAFTAAGSSALYLGEIEAALRHLERSVAHIGITSPVSPMASVEPAIPAYVFMAFASIVSGRLEPGRAAIASALQLGRAMEMPWYLGFALNMANLLAMVRRDFAEARRLANAVLAYGAEKNLPQWDNVTRVRLGWSEAFEKHDASLILPLREAADAFRPSGIIAVSHTYAALAEACLEVGRIDEAVDALDAAFDTRGEERIWDAELFRLRGVMALARADSSGRKLSAVGDAEQCFEQAVEIATTQGTKLFSLRATVALCRLWMATGQRESARASLGDALNGFDAGFGETDLREARALLDEIG